MKIFTKPYPLKYKYKEQRFVRHLKTYDFPNVRKEREKGQDMVMSKKELQEAVEQALMYFAMYGRKDTNIEWWEESRFNLIMADIVRAGE